MSNNQEYTDSALKKMTKLQLIQLYRELEKSSKVIGLNPPKVEPFITTLVKDLGPLGGAMIDPSEEQLEETVATSRRAFQHLHSADGLHLFLWLMPRKKHALPDKRVIRVHEGLRRIEVSRAMNTRIDLKDRNQVALLCAGLRGDNLEEMIEAMPDEEVDRF